MRPRLSSISLIKPYRSGSASRVWPWRDFRSECSASHRCCPFPVPTGRANHPSISAAVHRMTDDPRSKTHQRQDEFEAFFEKERPQFGCDRKQGQARLTANLISSIDLGYHVSQHLRLLFLPNRIPSNADLTKSARDSVLVRGVAVVSDSANRDVVRSAAMGA